MIWYLMNTILELENLKSKVSDQKNWEYPVLKDPEVDWIVKQIDYAIRVRKNFGND